MDTELQLKLLMSGLWLFMAYKSYKPFSLNQKSYGWVKSTGLITTSSIDRMGNTYHPKIIYKYTHQGKGYINYIYTYLGVGHITKSKAIEISEKYPEGSETEIFIDPVDHENSVIVRGIHWYQYFSFALLTLFCVSVAYMGPILNFIWPGCEPNCK